jgi:hypothetical protein
MGLVNRNRALLIAAIAGVSGGFAMESEVTGRWQDPDNRGRRTEKSAARLAKAEEKRKRRAAKRLAHNVELTGGALAPSSDRRERG